MWAGKTSSLSELRNKERKTQKLKLTKARFPQINIYQAEPNTQQKYLFTDLTKTGLKMPKRE